MNMPNFLALNAPRSRWLVALVVGVLLLVMLAWGWRAPLVDGFTLQAQPLVRSVQFSARVAALARVDVGSTLTARVQQVLVREGVRVRAGDALVQLEADEWQAALRQAQAAQAQASARLLGLRSTGRSQAQAVLDQAHAGLQAARADMTRTEQLVSQGFLSPARLDESRRALAVAQALQASATAQWQANAGRNHESGTDLVQAQAQLEQARAATQAAQARLAQTVLRAPTDALVLTRLAEPGQIVQPGRALLTLALAGVTQLKAQVDERFLAQLQPGQPAVVVADAFADRRLAAHVQVIAPVVDAQRGAVEVTLALNGDAPAFLREDMTLSVEVETARRASALVLPLAALRPPAGGSVHADEAEVLLVQAGRASLRRVRLGVRNLQAAEVLDGLSAGDVVLLGSTLQPGARVRVRPVAAAVHATTADQTGQAGAAGAALGNAMGR